MNKRKVDDYILELAKDGYSVRQIEDELKKQGFKPLTYGRINQIILKHQV